MWWEGETAVFNHDQHLLVAILGHKHSSNHIFNNRCKSLQRQWRKQAFA